MAADTTKKLSISERLYTGDFAFEFVSKRRRWYLISALLIVISLLGLGIRGLNLGIEFTGGASFQVPTTVTATTIDDARTALNGSGVADVGTANVVTIGNSQVRVQTRSLSTEEVAQVREALATKFSITEEQVAYSLIGQSWGNQITQKGVQALLIFLALVALMIWAYFRDWKMSIAALVALIHDLVLTIGIYALVGFTVTPASLIGVLTILGYSLYDTVVVFDKVRENVKGMESSGLSYSGAANLAVNQVLIRSLNTTLIGVLPVGALLVAGAFVLGQGPLEDLGLALFVGLVSGAYSSIFIATPLLAQMREREPQMQQRAKAAARRQGKRASVATTAVSVVPVDASALGLSASADADEAESPQEAESVEEAAPEDDQPSTETEDANEPETRQQPKRRSRSTRTQGK